MSLNSDLVAAVTRWREYGAPCVPCNGVGNVPEKAYLPGVAVTTCSTCNGTGYVQPAIVKALIEAVTQTQVSLDGNSSLQTIRDWEEIGEGALWGVLAHAISRHTTETIGLGRSLYELDMDSCVIDSAALVAVDKALAQMFGEKP